VAQPVFFLLAGPNGAGKTTLYRAAVAEGLIPADAESVNADLYEAIASAAYRRSAASRVRYARLQKTAACP